MHCQFLQSYQYQAGHNTSIWFSSVVTYHLFWQRGHEEIWNMLSEEVLGDSKQHPLICQQENAERVLRGSFILFCVFFFSLVRHTYKLRVCQHCMQCTALPLCTAVLYSFSPFVNSQLRFGIDSADCLVCILWTGRNGHELPHNPDCHLRRSVQQMAVTKCNNIYVY